MVCCITKEMDYLLFNFQYINMFAVFMYELSIFFMHGKTYNSRTPSVKIVFRFDGVYRRISNFSAI